jgi:glycosyltransferase involved in cell wall biosynthesis
MKEPKVALIHDHLIQYGGAQKTLEAISKIFPNAPIYTGLYKPDNLSAYLNDKKISYPKNFFLENMPKYFSPIMPLIFEGFDLRDYDLIISDSSCWAKGVLTKPSQLHISYIHTPPRFLYGYSVESTKRKAWYFKPFVSVIDVFLRAWDFAAAQRPDYLIANSREVRGRIKKFYARDSVVINPPVELERTPILGKAGDGKYYLAVGRLVAYKNFLPLIEAFNINGLSLIIAGTGPEEEKLRSLAKTNIKFEGKVSEERKKELIKNCLGLINPVENEDFGIVPVEAMNFGKPVLVHRSGGHLETVTENRSGMFFDDLSPESLSQKILEFDKKIKSRLFNPEEISKSIADLSEERFTREFKTFVMEKWELHQNANA